MTDEQGFLVRLTRLAKLCQFALDEELFEFYDRALCDLGYPKLNEVLESISLNRRSRDPFPSVREIRDFLEPALTPESAAQELLSRAIEAVQAFGYIDPEGARKYMGEELWNALPGAQGWQEFCFAGDATDSTINIASARAQLRERLKASLIKNNPSGRVILAAPATAKPSLDSVLPLPTQAIPSQEPRLRLVPSPEEAKKLLNELYEKIAKICEPKDTND